MSRVECTFAAVGAYADPMSLISHDSGAVRSVAEINAAIRAFTAGRLVWSPEALTELARLRDEWREAVAREAALAA